MGRIVVISNPLSRRNRDRKGRLERLLACYPDVMFRELADIAEIPRIFVEIEALNPDLVVINGGDGTVIAIATHVISNGLSARMPPFAVLPGGQTNMIASDLGTAVSPERTMARLRGLVQTGNLDRYVSPRPFLRLDRKGVDPIYGTFFGTAAIVHVILFCRRHIFPLRVPRFVALVLAAVVLVAVGLWPGKGRRAVFPPGRISYTVDGKAKTTEELFLFFATTLDNLVLALSFPHEPERGAIQVTTVTYAHKSIMRALWTLITRRNHGASGLGTYTTRRLGIELDGPFTLDGELFKPEGRETIQLSEGPSLRFVKF